MYIVITPGGTLKALLGIILFLVIASSLGVAWFIAYPPVERVPLWVNLFNLNLEANIPTLFSSLQLLAASCLLFGIAHCHRAKQQASFSWYLLGVIFIGLAIDETAALHENLTVYLRSTLGTSGYFYYAWVIPYGLAALLLAVLFANFLLRLPRATGVGFVVAGGLYLTGSLGLEMLAGKYISSPGAQEITYSLLYTVEETFEMLGIALFIYALLKYITRTFVQLDYSVRG